MWAHPLARFSHYGYSYLSRVTRESREGLEFAGYHPGVDLNGPGAGDADLGQPVRCLAFGQVAFIRDAARGGELRGFGTLIGIRIDDPTTPGRHVTARYAHCQRINPKLRVGHIVHAGEQIAEIGRESGRDLLGRPFHRGMTAHLHLDILKVGLPIADYAHTPYLHTVYPDHTWPEGRVEYLFLDPTPWLEGGNQ